MTKHNSRTAIIAALIGNLLVTVTKGIAAAITGSSAMLSEAVHSVVDTGNEVLLLYGQHRAAKPADEVHPYGYGRELYFWSFVVALLIFAVGAGVSLYEGVTHVRAPEPIERPLVVYIDLALAFIFEGASWVFAWKVFAANRRSINFLTEIKTSKDPTNFMVLVEDSAALLGIFIALAGTFLSVTLGEPRIDGAASVLIGLVLAAVAFGLARESKQLLIGERAAPELSAAIRETVAAEECVIQVVNITTSQLAPGQVIATLGVVIDPTLGVPEVEQLIQRIEKSARAKHPDLFRVFVRPQSADRAPDPNADRADGGLTAT